MTMAASGIHMAVGVFSGCSTSANPQSGGVGTIVTGAINIAGWDGRILLCVTPGVHS